VNFLDWAEKNSNIGGSISYYSEEATKDEISAAVKKST